MENNKICCFLGHREIERSYEIITKAKKIIEELILKEKINVFLFGSRSQFIDLCYEIVSSLKTTFPYIKRIYIRAEYEVISQQYENYLLKYYEATLFPKTVVNSKKYNYIKRNEYMIDKSILCIFYYRPKDNKQNQNKGTKIAYKYAERKKKNIILL